MQAITRADAPVKQFGKPEYPRNIALYFGEPGTYSPGPQAFLVDMPFASATVKPHFHPVRQFQVIARGAGKLGKKPLRRLSFHYADPNTPYGPIVGEEDGIAFFTLRPEFSGATHYMPGNRDKMGGKAGRNFAQYFASTDCAAHPAGEARFEVLMERRTDGLEAHGLHLGPNASARGVDPTTGGGQYYLVADGSLMDGDATLLADSLIWVAADDAAPTLQAGPDGAHVLLMQFPVASPAQAAE